LEQNTQTQQLYQLEMEMVLHLIATQYRLHTIILHLFQHTPGAQASARSTLTQQPCQRELAIALHLDKTTIKRKGQEND
jgi:hypothetical protein